MTTRVAASVPYPKPGGDAREPRRRSRQAHMRGDLASLGYVSVLRAG